MLEGDARRSPVALGVRLDLGAQRVVARLLELDSRLEPKLHLLDEAAAQHGIARVEPEPYGLAREHLVADPALGDGVAVGPLAAERLSLDERVEVALVERDDLLVGLVRCGRERVVRAEDRGAEHHEVQQRLARGAGERAVGTGHGA